MLDGREVPEQNDEKLGRPGRPLSFSLNLLLGAATGSNSALNVKSSICLSDESAAGISSVSLPLIYSTHSAIAAVDTQQ